MTPGTPNIIQAEFSLILRDCSGLSAVFEDLLDRASDRMPSKVVVRFYDPDGSLGTFIGRFARIQRTHQQDGQRLPSARGLHRWFLRKRLSKNICKLIAMQTTRVSIARASFMKALALGRAIAIEPRGADFRLLERAEEHDTIEAVARARDVTLFLFPHNRDLLVDGVPVLAHSTLAHSK